MSPREGWQLRRKNDLRSIRRRKSLLVGISIVRYSTGSLPYGPIADADTDLRKFRGEIQIPVCVQIWNSNPVTLVQTSLE